MIVVHWIGRSPPSTFANAARRRKIRLAAKPGPGAIAQVHFGSRLEDGKDSTLPWIWISPRPVGRAAAIEATVRGAYDAFSLLDHEPVARLGKRLDELRGQATSTPVSPAFVTQSSAGHAVLSQLHRAAQTSMPVLLTGETGTGKEVAARLIHEWSERKKKTFVAINCAAIPNELMEAELFGYARGAFSGAVSHYDGQLMAAEGGSVLLDEIDDTPTNVQSKLLRVLEDRIVSRIGQNEWHKVNFRLLAATNRDLKSLIAQGSFGPDLYERLAIVSIRLPPLRERREDIPALAIHFIERFYDEEPTSLGRGRVVRVTGPAMEILENYSWPGNIRELRNAIFEVLVHKRCGDEILLSDLPRRFLRTDVPDVTADAIVDDHAIARNLDGGRFNLRRESDHLSRTALRLALERTNGSPAKAARLLGEVGRGGSSDPGGTVRAMMKRLGIRRRGRS